MTTATPAFPQLRARLAYANFGLDNQVDNAMLYIFRYFSAAQADAAIAAACDKLNLTFVNEAEEDPDGDNFYVFYAADDNVFTQDDLFDALAEALA